MLLVGYVALALLYAVVTPLFEKPDEQWHFAFAMYLVETGRLPVQRVEGRDHLAEQEGSQPPLYYALLAGLLKGAGLDELGEGYAALTVPNPYYGGRPGAWHDNANQFLHGPCQGACQQTATAVYLGRGLSILCGLLALVAAAAALRLAFPDEVALHLGVVGVMAFNPQFLHISSSVSQDALTVAMVNLAFALALWWWREPTGRRALALGAVAGLAALAKPSGLSALVTGGLWLLVAGRVPWSVRLRHGLLFGAAFAGVSGWWFARNLMLYGEATGTAIHLRVYGAEIAPPTVSSLRAEWQAVANSFWASFGWGGLNPSDAIYRAARTMALLLGLLSGVALVRRWRAWGEGARLLVGFSLFHLLLVGFLLQRWMLLTVAPLGRLLFPALLPISLLLVLGLASVLPRRWQRPAVGGYLASWAAICLLFALLLVRPAYVAAPVLSALPPAATPLDARFGDEIALVGYEVPSGSLAPGDALPLTLYWQPLRAVEEAYSVSVKLFGRGGQLLAESNSHPDGGRSLTTTWQPAAALLYPDRAMLLLDPAAQVPTLASIEIDLFRHEDLSHLPVTVAGQPVRPFRPIRLVVRDGSPPAPAADFSYRPHLTELTITEGTLTAALAWEVGQPLATDYQALFHLAPAPEQPPLATADFAPMKGDYPTSLWQPGERLDDVALLDLPPDALPGDYLLLLGLYDPQSLQRLPGANNQEVWVLARLRWDGREWERVEE